ncbi:imidazole glycerol phosphate synthase subunit HisH 1 [Oxobacter pfennigii]|uniref:Imidazole glycerol phosphate synthase subunit HisH n=1 Tax=Oxobacter pfennigii TaxID=36849 RepID=A0A0P8YYU2_9CLOT|nr:imidazole glycerol phosphate synthase subunit HisH [Oxobacter pfennigii]KPU44965.1 imidazole glycerol phosphate synthase subunit HisH 1 [Oxobacter pfennigii]
MIAIIDYGMGNLKNIYKAMEYVGAKCCITSDPNFIRSSDGVILPGVGAFKDAIDCIKENKLEEAIIKSVKDKKPFLGICLGMQLLFEKSFENGIHDGLGILKGEVKMIPEGVKIPHMGWNSLKIKKNRDPILQGLDESNVYFVHSYYCEPKDTITSSVTDYGVDITASVSSANVFGLQFHPEKSGQAGLKMLDNFRRMVK